MDNGQLDMPVLEERKKIVVSSRRSVAKAPEIAPSVTGPWKLAPIYLTRNFRFNLVFFSSSAILPLPVLGALFYAVIVRVLQPVMSLASSRGECEPTSWPDRRAILKGPRNLSRTHLLRVTGSESGAGEAQLGRPFPYQVTNIHRPNITLSPTG